MSHASLLVALTLDGKPSRTKIEAAVGELMAPFEEGERGWFADGSRWDWWVIGGRWTGHLSLDGYDPDTDPRNIETCDLCNGTGKRDDQIGREHRQREPAYGCNGCNGKGKRVKWSPAPYEGDVMRRADVDLPTYERVQKERLVQQFTKAQAEPERDRKLIWGVEPKETLEQFLAREHVGFPPFHAFLRNQVWQESGRMGWFGASTATECERAGRDAHICVHEQDGARIVSWSDSVSWNQMFYKRFVEPLPSETLLVVVDYHV